MKLSCDACGKAFATKQNLKPGKKVRCPACKEPIVVPDPDEIDEIEEEEEEEEEQPRRSERVKARSNQVQARRDRSRNEDETDEDEEEEGPRPRKRRRSERVKARSNQVQARRGGRSRDEDEIDDDEEEERPRRKRRRKRPPARGGALAYVVIGLAALGALTSGLLGMIWTSDANSTEVQVARKLVEEAAQSSDIDEASKAKAQELVDEIDSHTTSAYLLLLAVVLAIAGGVFAFLNKGIIAGPILLVACILPAIFALKSLVFSCPLLIAGGIAFLLRGE